LYLASTLKKLAVDEAALLKLLHRWRKEAEEAGHRITRITVGFEAGRDGFWLARWLRARDVEAHVIHASSVAVSRVEGLAEDDAAILEAYNRRVGAAQQSRIINRIKATLARLGIRGFNLKLKTLISQFPILRTRQFAP
jgi:transposase